MAHFRSIIRGTRGEASRLGSKQSGMVAHVDGWNSGITVYATHEDGKDVFYVHATGGSNGAVPSRRIARIADGIVELSK